MKLLFGSVISVILLGIYTYAVTNAIAIVSCLSTAGCTAVSKADFSAGMASALSTVGGLVSALVIAELAVTTPGEAPMARAFAQALSGKAEVAVKILTACYVAVWILAGLAAFVVGYLKHPGILQPLTDLGQSWFGLAVAAGYSYFGIKPR